MQTCGFGEDVGVMPSGRMSGPGGDGDGDVGSYPVRLMLRQRRQLQALSATANA